MPDSHTADSDLTFEEQLLWRPQLIAMWAVAIIGAACMYWAFSDYVFEDSYITFRYARNVAEGNGYVFTLGERVFGATAPLHTLLLAACGWFGADIPSSAGVVTALGLAGVGVLGGHILRHFRCPNAAVLFALFAVSGPTRTYWGWGLETALLSALVMAGMLAALKRRDSLAGVLAGLTFLTRYDGALFAVTLFAFLLLRRKKMPWRPGLIATAVVLPWLIFAQFYFGSILPNTLAAKVGDVGAREFLTISGMAQLAGIWRPITGGDPSIFHLSQLDVVLSSALGVAAAIGCLRFIWKESLLGILVSYPLVLWGGYALIGPPVVFTWYLIPAVFPLLLAGFLGAGALLPRANWCRPRFMTTMVVAVAGLFVQPWNLNRLANQLMSESNYTGRVAAYTEIGDWILEHDMTEFTILCHEPGYLTYRTNNPVVDAAGLVTKGVFMHGDESRRTSFSELAKEKNTPLVIASLPQLDLDYVAVYHAYPHKTLFMRPDLHARYFDRLVADLENSSKKSSGVTPLRHPFYLDAGEDVQAEWRKLGGQVDLRGRRRPLVIDGEPVSELTLNIDINRIGAHTPPFVIDFDRLAFRWTANATRTALVQLVIAGCVVYEQGGLLQPPFKGTTREFSMQSWPVGHWRGETATLRFVHTGWRGGVWMATDHIHSVVSENRLLVEDFESGEGYGELWSTTFGDAPSELRPIAENFGIEFDYSKRAAVSRGIPGKHRMTSKPFLIERNLLSMLVLDFGIAKGMAVRLFVDGKVVRRFKASDSRKLRPVTWDVRAFKGSEAVLQISDMHESPKAWIGIDEIEQIDE